MSSPDRFRRSRRGCPAAHHTILRAAGPISVDGHLDEPSWEADEVIDQFVFPWWTEGSKDRTEARLLWDDVHLYVAFTAHDPHISATLTERDSPVSRDDCVEVFIALDISEGTNYFNFEFNALGTILDHSLHADRSSMWNGEGVQRAIDIKGTLNQETDQDTLWTTEIALPFAVFAPYAPNLPPTAGDVWRLNLYRTGGAVNLQYITALFADASLDASTQGVPVGLDAFEAEGEPAMAVAGIFKQDILVEVAVVGSA